MKRISNLTLLGIMLGLPILGFKIAAFIFQVLDDIKIDIAEKTKAHIALGCALFCLLVAFFIIAEEIKKRKTDQN